jgi:VanZ family protein
MALIFWSSTQTGGSDIPEWGRKIVHFSEFGILAALWLWALRPALGVRAYAVAAAVAVLYAISDEFHQSFVEGRDSDPWDALVDTLGVATALTIVYARENASTRRIQSRSSG